MAGGVHDRGSCMAGGMHGMGACMAGGGDMHGRGGMCGGGNVWQGVCMAGGMCGRGHVWQGEMYGGGMHGKEGMCGRRVCMAWVGACMAGGGMCGRREHAWQEVYMAGGHVWQERWPLQQTVHILLECILFGFSFLSSDFDTVLFISGWIVMEFSLNVFTEFSDKTYFSLKWLKPATSCVRDQNGTTEPARHM